MHTRTVSFPPGDPPWRLLPQPFGESSYLVRLRRMCRGLRAPRDSGVHRAARTELQRQAAPVAALLFPLLSVLLLMLLAAAARPLATTSSPRATPDDEPVPTLVPVEPPTPVPMDANGAAADPTGWREAMDPATEPAHTELVTRAPEAPRLLPPVRPTHGPGLPGLSLPPGYGDRLTPEGRQRTGAAPASEDAVVRALRWLKLHQQADGSWTGERQGDARTAMTALAVLCFLAHGDVPGNPRAVEFGPAAQRGIEFLLAAQQPHGLFAHRDGHNYTQPIAAYALCEAFGMTRNPNVRQAAECAVRPIVDGQHASGGWDYNLAPATDRDDTSYMAWCAQALRAASLAGLPVPGLAEACRLAVRGFQRNAAPALGGFGYTAPGQSGLSAAGALCLQLLGAPEVIEVRRTLAWLEPATCRFDDWARQPYGGASPVYYWYYLTQARFHAGGTAWKQWERQFAPELVRAQRVELAVATDADGRPAAVGSWTSPSPAEHSAGTVQDTCLCALQLMVYYRYLQTYAAAAVTAAPLAAARSEFADDTRVDVDL